MKTSINIFNRLSANEIITLTQEVKETIAVLKHKTQKHFSSADLWNIQRKKRSSSLKKVML